MTSLRVGFAVLFTTIVLQSDARPEETGEDPIQPLELDYRLLFPGYTPQLPTMEPVPDDPENLLVNGSFERRDGTPPNPNIDTLQPGENDLIGWEIVDGPVDVIGPQRWLPAHGSFCLDLDGGVRQTVSTMPGEVYVLSFRLAGNVEAPPTEKTLRVRIDDLEKDFQFNALGHTRTRMGWTIGQLEFTAARHDTVITLLNAKPNAQSSGVALDRVDLRTKASLESAQAAAEESRQVYLLKQIPGLLEEARALRAAGRIEEAEQHIEKARYRRAELEAWLREQFGE